MVLRPLRSIGSAIRDTDVGALRWAVPLRVAVVTTAMVAVLLAAGRPAEALVMGIGSLVTGVADQRGPVAARVKGMAFMAMGTAIAASLGVLVSEPSWLRLLGTALVAFGCGFMARMGPRSSIIGQVSLVVFVVLAGAPAAADTAAPEGLLMLAGGGIQLAVAVASQLAGRTGGVRTDICVAWRSVGHSLRESRMRYGATSPVAKVEAARAGVYGLRADTAVSRPLMDLIDALARVRVGGVIVLSAPFEGDGAGRAALDRLTDAAGAMAIAVGHAVESPRRKGSMEKAYRRFDDALERYGDAGGDHVRVGVAEMTAGLHMAAALVRAGVPRGPARSVPIAMTQATEPVSGLVGGLTFGDVIVRHAIRLALATTAGTAIALAAGFPHTYWIPMTVAWVLRPDLAGTGVRVASRLLGTIAGLVLAGVVIGIAGAGPLPVVTIVFVGSLVFAAFLMPNYAVSTAGATMFIIGMFSYLGDPLIATLDARALGTLIAGLLAMTVALLIPAPTTEVLCGMLGGLAADLATYARMVRTGAAATARRSALDRLALTRVAVGRVVEQATQEARLHRVHPERAAEMLRDLIEAMAVVAAVDIGGAAAFPAGVPKRVVDDSADLALRLRVRQADEPVPPRALPPAGADAHAAERAVDDAQVTFDRALGDREPLAA